MVAPLGLRRCLCGLALAAAALALVASVPSAGAKTGPLAPCPTAGALVVYHETAGLAYKNSLVIGEDGHASLCWGRRASVGVVTGHRTFVVSGRTLKVLRETLDRIEVEHLGPPPAEWPPCCLRLSRALVYKDTGIPYQGRPNTTSAIHALNQAHAILGRIIKRNEPDL